MFDLSLEVFGKSLFDLVLGMKDLFYVFSFLFFLLKNMLVKIFLEDVHHWCAFGFRTLRASYNFRLRLLVILFFLIIFKVLDHP